MSASSHHEIDEMWKQEYSMIFLIVWFRFTADLGGYPFLYADTFMTREEFEQMFDLTAYEKARQKYNAVGAFPHLHDKVS